MDFDNDHPRVFFPSDSSGTTAKFGFLFFRDRKAWAAETLENARAGLPAMRHSLDPMLLDRLSDTAQGERRFEYVGQVPRR
jgi:hypothetical protein